MNLNLVDLSKSIKAEYKGKFYDTIYTTIDSVGATNIRGEMLDSDKDKKNMDNADFLDRINISQENNIDFIGELARNTGVPTDKIQYILSALVNNPIRFNKKGECSMRESLQIGDKIEINNSGDGPNNYAGMLNSFGIVKELKTRILGLEKLLKEKDELISAQRETIELLKSK